MNTPRKCQKLRNSSKYRVLDNEDGVDDKGSLGNFLGIFFRKIQKLLCFRNASHSTENSGNFKRKIKCNGNPRLEILGNFGIPRMVILFPWSCGNCCSIRYYGNSNQKFLSNGKRPWKRNEPGKRASARNSSVNGKRCIPFCIPCHGKYSGQQNRCEKRAAHNGKVTYENRAIYDGFPLLWLAVFSCYK